VVASVKSDAILTSADIDFSISRTVVRQLTRTLAPSTKKFAHEDLTFNAHNF
jgi:hypothetical protein